MIAAYFSPTVSPANAQVRDILCSRLLSLTFSGWVQPYLSDAQGRGVGFNPASGAMENAIPEAVLATEARLRQRCLEQPVRRELHYISQREIFRGISV